MSRPWGLVAPLAASLVVFLGCGTAAPPRGNVLSDTPSQTTGAAEDQDTGIVDDGWIAGFGDPQLADLVDEALINNPDLGTAAARVHAAAAAAVEASARLEPTLELAFDAAGSGASSASTAESVVGLSASWEADVWGRLESRAAPVGASSRATRADHEFGRQSLAAQTAKGWFLATQTHALLTLALEIVDLHEKILHLLKTERENGRVTTQDVHAASADLASAEEALRQAIAGDQQARHSLMLLLGRSPGAEVESCPERKPLPPPVPAGLSARLLERRPDLVAAEDGVAAAFELGERRDVARMPPIALTSTSGASTDVRDLIVDLGAGRVAPLFRGGALSAAVDRADARQQAAIVAYGRAVMSALEEVVGSLDNEALFAELEEQLRIVLRENEQALEIAGARYEAGTTGRLSGLRTQARVVGARIALIGIRANRLVQRINLHLALGGSFERAAGRRVVAGRARE